MNKAILLSFGLALLVTALYWPATGFDFIRYDDPTHLTENPLLREGMTREALGAAFSRPTGELIRIGLYIPLTWLSFMADIELWGTSPRGFHLTNILLHAANMALLLLLLWRMTGSTWRSALAASLVALHPLRVESVAWITERKDVLSLFFLLLALAAYLAWTRSGKKRWYASLCALFACSLLSKPMAVTFPLLLLLLDFWPLGRALPGRGARQWLPLIKEKLPLFLLALPISLYTLASAGVDTGARKEGVSLLLYHLEHGVVSPLVYLRKTFWPSDLALRMEYLHPGPAWGDLLVGGAALLLITWLAWRARRERPWALFGWGWFLAALLPVGGAIPAGSLPGIADRFTYLPHLGLMAALAWSAGSLSRNGKVSRFLVPAAAALCLLALAGTTRAALPAWKDTVSLFTRAWEFSPNDPTVNLNLGSSLNSRGEAKRAEFHFRELIKERPDDSRGFYNLGIVLEEQGRREEALAAYEKALAVDPGYTSTLLRASRLLLALGRPAEALPLAQTYLNREEDSPFFPTALLLAGQSLAGMGKGKEAVPFLERTLLLAPNESAARLELAEVFLAQRSDRLAASHWRAVADARPGTAESLFARGRLLDLEDQKEEARRLYSQALSAPPANPAFPDLVPEILGRSKK